MRPIKDIYNDIINIYAEKAIFIGLNPDTKKLLNHTGDSQMLSNDFLCDMHDRLFELIEYAAKTTRNEPYAAEKVVVFDTGWWGITLDQQKQINDYYKKGFEAAPIKYRSFWNLDENGSIVQPIAAASRSEDTNSNIIYNGELISTTNESNYIAITMNGQFNDRYRYDDFPAITSGALFNPSLVYMESYSDIEAWLEAYDSVLNVLKNSIFAGLRTNNEPFNFEAYIDCKMLLYPYRPISDMYTARSSFSEYNWYDELTEESGTVVQQKVILSRFGDGSDSVTIYVYSEAVSYNIIIGYDPETGEPIYDTITLSTSKDGVKFNDDLVTLHSLAKSKFNNTYGYTLFAIFELRRINTIQNVLETEYSGGELSLNGDGYFKVLDRTIYGYSELNSYAGFPFNSYDNFTVKLYSRWERVDLTDETNEIATGLTELGQRTSNGFPYEYSVKNQYGTIGMISTEFEGVYQQKTLLSIDKQLLYDNVEVVDIPL